MSAENFDADVALERAITAELQAAEAMLPPIDVRLAPVRAFHLIAILQLVLRHPELPDMTREAAGELVARLATVFEEFPAIRLVIERGADPQFDPRARRARLEDLLPGLDAALGWLEGAAAGRMDTTTADRFVPHANLLLELLGGDAYLEDLATATAEAREDRERRIILPGEL